MLDEVAPTLARLERLSIKPFIAFFEPPSLDDRMMNQAAVLSRSSRADLSVSRWLYDHKKLFHRIFIPAKLKQEIRDKLDQANINERILFPGLDGLSLWLTRYYSPTGMPNVVSRDFRDAMHGTTGAPNELDKGTFGTCKHEIWPPRVVRQQAASSLKALIVPAISLWNRHENWCVNMALPRIVGA